jgi:hypothetical protein
VQSMVIIAMLTRSCLIWSSDTVAMNLSKNFSLKELTASSIAVRHGVEEQFKPPPQAMVNMTALTQNVLQKVRDQFGSVRVTSCFRHPHVNEIVGGSSTSDHCCSFTKAAADFEVISEDVSNLELAIWIRDNLRYSQLILEFYNPDEGPNSGWVHVSYDSVDQDNKMEVLTASRVKGKVKYTPGLPE